MNHDDVSLLWVVGEARELDWAGHSFVRNWQLVYTRLWQLVYSSIDTHHPLRPILSIRFPSPLFWRPVLDRRSRLSRTQYKISFSSFLLLLLSNRSPFVLLLRRRRHHHSHCRVSRRCLVGDPNDLCQCLEGLSRRVVLVVVAKVLEIYLFICFCRFFFSLLLVCSTVIEFKEKKTIYWKIS